MNRRNALILLSLMLMIMTAVNAQDITPMSDDEIDPNVNISWPPPVYVVRGRIELRGTANLEDMGNYFLEFRPALFGPDAENRTDGWFPITLPMSNPVVDDVLGVWNTETTQDGLYEIRISVYGNGLLMQDFIVRPLRIENQPPPFVVIDPTQDAPAIRATFTPMATSSFSRPTLVPSPTALDSTPRVTANTDANVRSGDGVGYSVIDALLAGQTARVVGRSSRSNGWYYIQLPDGSRGWIAPSVVTAAGNIGATSYIEPPATSTPVATATPPSSGNLAGTSPSIIPNPPTCSVQFNVMANITNSGTAATLAAATVIIQDVHVATGAVQAQIITTVPQLAPGDNFVVGGDFTISTYYNEQHIIRVLIDTGNAVNESYESDNVLESSYILQQGGC